MSLINIPLFELGKSNRDLYNICQLVLKAKDIKTVTPEIVTAGGSCLVELFTFSPTLALKYTTQLKTALGTNPITRQTSFQFNTQKSRYDPYEYIPRFYTEVLNSYITVCGQRYQDMSKKYGLPENETYRTSINSAADLLTTVAKLCNILLPLCKRKKVDCFHIQTALKIIYLADNTALDKLLIKTINSTAKVLVNDDTLSNTTKTDPMISKTVATFNSILTGGITITNEASVYLSMFILSLNSDIDEPDKLITLSTKRVASKKKKSPSATPVSKTTVSIADTPVTDTTQPDIIPSQTVNNNGNDNNLAQSTSTEMPQKLYFKLKI